MMVLDCDWNFAKAQAKLKKGCGYTGIRESVLAHLYFKLFYARKYCLMVADGSIGGGI
jgi:hypothetical protein